jgi:hypothetical protein
VCCVAGGASKSNLQGIMAELGQGVRKGGSSGLLQKMAVLKELELEEEASAVSEEIQEMLKASKECAEGEAGDSVKYEQAAQVVKKRWLLFFAERVRNRRGLLDFFPRSIKKRERGTKYSSLPCAEMTLTSSCK